MAKEDLFSGEISPKGYLPDYLKKIMADQTKASSRRNHEERRQARREREEIEKWLNNIETIGCCFPFEIKHSKDDAVIWDGKEDGVATVITDYLGHKKTAYVIPQNRIGKCALIPLKVHDYIFHAETIKIKKENGESEEVRLCKVYQMIDEIDGKAMWMLINVCLGGVWGSTSGKLSGRKAKEWDKKLPPRFAEAYRAINARFNGSKIPFAERPQQETE